MSAIAFHPFNSLPVGQRLQDGYLNATAMCQASDKQFNDYFRLKTAQDFLDALSRSTGIPVDLLVQKIVTGVNENRGTWVHPLVAVNAGAIAGYVAAQFAHRLAGRK